MSKDDLIRAITEMQAAKPGYDLAESFYTGSRAELFSSAALQRKLKRTKDRYKLNFAQVPVNAVADKLIITAITVVGSTGQDDDTLTTIFDKEVWRANQMAKRHDEVMRKACMYGDSYLFVWTGPQDTEDTLPSVVMVYNSPKTSRMIYDEDITFLKRFYAKYWVDDTGKTQGRLYYPDHFEEFTSTADAKRLTDPNAWTVTDESVPNPYGEIPAWHFHNTSGQFGKPEHFDGYGAQDAINKMSTTLVHSGEFQGWPQRYGLVEAGAAMSGESADAPDWDDEADITDPAQAENRTRLGGGPGSMQLLPGMKEVGQWNAADASNFIDPLSFYIRAMSELTSTPLHEFDTTGGAPSGETLKAVDRPLNDKINSRHRGFEPDWQGSGQFGMKILGHTGVQLNIQWQNPFPINDKEGWEVIQLKVQMGVPPQQALIEAGYSPAQVAEWFKD